MAAVAVYGGGGGTRARGWAALGAAAMHKGGGAGERRGVRRGLGGAAARRGVWRRGVGRRRGEERCWFDVFRGGGCLGIYIGEGRVLLGVGDKK